jgi:hypothetical protein
MIVRVIRIISGSADYVSVSVCVVSEKLTIVTSQTFASRGHDMSVLGYVSVLFVREHAFIRIDQVHARFVD